jgi:TfoX/Sxy family transcriptional regulator of competence genes
MPIPKPAAEDRAFFQAVLPPDERVEIKPMFGNLGAFVAGNMFAGLFGADVGVRLGDADRATLLAQKGAGPFGPAERPMGGYVALPAAWRDDPETARLWTARALSFVATMPPKTPRRR